MERKYLEHMLPLCDLFYTSVDGRLKASHHHVHIAKWSSAIEDGQLVSHDVSLSLYGQTLAFHYVRINGTIMREEGRGNKKVWVPDFFFFFFLPAVLYRFRAEYTLKDDRRSWGSVLP